MRVGNPVPPDFTDFVVRHDARLARACAEVAGNDQVAHAMRLELLVAVAGRWRRWAPGARTTHALVRLENLLRRRAREYRAAPRPSALDLTSTLHLRASPEQPADDESADLAAAVWGRAVRVRRRRWTWLGAAALVLLAVVALVPPGEKHDAVLPDRIPDGVTILAPFAELTEASPDLLALPAYLLLDPASVDAMPSLESAPLARAVVAANGNAGRLVLAGYAVDPSAGDDEQRVIPDRPNDRRRVEHPALAGAGLLATSLSPDGTTVALSRGADLVLVDVRSGQVRTVTVGALQPEVPILLWLSTSTILLPGPDEGIVVDALTGDVTAVDVLVADVLTARGFEQPRLSQLVATTPSDLVADDAIRAVLLRWRETDALERREPAAGAGQVGIRRIVAGPRWLGDWAGPGWVSPEVVARACDPDTLLLPRGIDPAVAAIVAIAETGDYLGTLAATGSVRVEVLGFDDPQRILVAAYVDGRSALLAWDPRSGAITLGTLMNAETSISVADLLAT